MAQQSKSWQKKYLSTVKTFDNLYWYCEAVLPPSMRTGLLTNGYTPVGYPGRWIPCVPIGNAPEASRRIAEMLCAIFRPHVPYAMSVEPVITDAECLKQTGALWYNWTDTIPLDIICSCCGSIEVVAHTIAEEDGYASTKRQWLCGDCIDSGRWHEQYVERIR